MIVSAWQQVSFPLLYPFLPLMALAFRAMAIPATIIADADIATCIAGIYMASQCCGAALFYSPQGLLLMDGERER
jgi:hypothetical protein